MLSTRMNSSHLLRVGWTAALALVAISLLGLPAYAQSYQVTRLVSDIANITGDNPADADLGNPWGLVASPTSPWWVADNGTGVSTLYNGNGVKQGLTVTIPDWTGSGTGVPSGIAFNGTSDFQLTTNTVAALSILEGRSDSFRRSTLYFPRHHCVAVWIISAPQ